MAESAKISHLWEPNYDEKWKSSVIENEVLLDTLGEKLPVIRKSIDLCDKFWSLLLQRGVVNEETKSKIQGYDQRKAQSASLIHHIMNVEVYKFHGFIWALVNSNQCRLTELLGFAARDYLDVDVFLMSSAFQCPACYEIYTKAYILTGCGHYVCAPCIKGAQFLCKDNKKEDVTCPVPECGKITEASPSDGKIDLEEDGDFSDLCEAMLKEVKKESAQTTEGKQTAENEVEEEEVSNTGSEEKEGMSADSEKEEDKDEQEAGEEEKDNLSQCLQERKEEEEEKTNTGSQEEEGMTNDDEKEEGPVSLSQHLQEGISDLEMKISCLQKYKGILGKYESSVKDHIVGVVENVKQDVDEWAEDTLGWYSSLCLQVEKNLLKSVKWQKVASELSVLVTARPQFLEGFLKGKVDLPKETVTDAGEKVITKLDSGCSIPLLFPYGGCGEQTFSYTVESISKLTDTQHSPPCMVRNMPWTISVRPHYDEPTDQQKEKSLAVFLHAEARSDSLLWSCNVAAELRLLSWEKNGKPETGEVEQLYSNKNTSWGFHSFLLWNELMDPENGYVKSDCIRLEVHIVAGPLTWREKSCQELLTERMLQTLQQMTARLEKSQQECLSS